MGMDQTEGEEQYDDGQDYNPNGIQIESHKPYDYEHEELENEGHYGQERDMEAEMLEQ